MTTHRERCEREATRGAVFLFQVNRYDVLGLPDGITYEDGSFFRTHNEDGEELEEEESVSLDEIKQETFGDYDTPCILDIWKTESVWLDRDEATAFGEAKSYRYGQRGRDWRVYCVCADGDLAKLLQKQDETNSDTEVKTKP